MMKFLSCLPWLGARLIKHRKASVRGVAAKNKVAHLILLVDLFGDLVARHLLHDAIGRQVDGRLVDRFLFLE